MPEVLKNSEDELLKAHTLISDRSGSATHISFPPAATLVKLPVAFAGVPKTRTRRSASFNTHYRTFPAYFWRNVLTHPLPLASSGSSASLFQLKCIRAAADVSRVSDGSPSARRPAAAVHIGRYRVTTRLTERSHHAILWVFFSTAKMARNACKLHAEISGFVQKSVKYYLGLVVGLVGARRHLWWESTTKQPKMRRRDFETRECITTMKALFFFFTNQKTDNKSMK